MRQFHSPSGRAWTVQVARSDNPAIGGDVLRFWSQGLVCELAHWPSDWERVSDSTLVDLLDRALTDWVATPRSNPRIIGISQSSRLNERENRI
jgi:hypothetical protein